jgi:Domain of unknown function (DUF4365)
MTNFPRRPLSHVSGDEAVRIFVSACPPDWIISNIQPDYGLDLRIELARDGNVTGEEFYVQLKGRRNVNVTSAPQIEVSIAQSTINYWLGKLHPVLVVLVDVSQRRYWFNWLEYAYSNYPQYSEEKEEVKLLLNRNSENHSLIDEASKYLSGYFTQLRRDLSKTFESTQVTRMLFHVTRLIRLCSQMVIFLQRDTKHLSDEEIIESWRLFYQDFALNDLVLRIPWHVYVNQALERSSNIVFALESRFKEYERLRDTYYQPEDASEVRPKVPVVALLPVQPPPPNLEWKLQYITPKYHELLENILPTIDVLQCIEEMLFQILLIGRVRFQDEES